MTAAKGQLSLQGVKLGAICIDFSGPKTRLSSFLRTNHESLITPFGPLSSPNCHLKLGSIICLL